MSDQDLTGSVEPETIAWQNVRVRLGDLQPWEHNPRQMSQKQAERLLASWRDFGQVETVAVSPAFEVYDGHQRLSALLTVHGAGYEIDARQSSRVLADDERKRLILALHAGAFGAWDWDVLSGWDVELLQQQGGFDEAMLASLKRDMAGVLELIDFAKSEATQSEPKAELKESPEKDSEPVCECCGAKLKTKA